MKILLHICCAPCAVYTIKKLKEKYDQLECFFYNPNIHPASEYKKRKDACLAVSELMGVKIYFYRDFHFEDFFKKTLFAEGNQRCSLCWGMRLTETAEYASKNDFDGFTSTLFISPYQDHDKLISIARDAQNKYSIAFIYEDFRTGFRESHKVSREMGLYHQKYCGCIYSERDRILKTQAI
jgi:epoxyqueuosine reductase